MKIKEGFILKEIAGSFVVVPVGEDVVDFSVLLFLNQRAYTLEELLRLMIATRQ